MPSSELANLLVFSTVGPFVTSLWIAGDFGLSATIFLIAQYLIRLPVFAEDSSLTWTVFFELQSFWNYTMMGFLIVASAGAGSAVRRLLKIPNLAHIRKLFWSDADRTQSKFLVPRNGTVFTMLVFALTSVGGVLIFHDIMIPENMYPLIAVITTPFMIATLYMLFYVLITWGFNNREGTALWGYDKDYLKGSEDEDGVPPLNKSVMRRTLFAMAFHQILMTVSIDIAIFASRDFVTTFIVASVMLGVLTILDILVYVFYMRELQSFAPYYSDWAAPIFADNLPTEDIYEDAEDYSMETDSFNAPPMKTILPLPTRKKVATRKSSLFSSVQRV